MVAAESLDQLELVGAMQDVRSLRVKLDVQRALAGDAARPDQLHEVTASTQADDIDVAQAHLGLAQVASQRGRSRTRSTTPRRRPR